MARKLPPVLRRMAELAERERRHLMDEFVRTRALMPILMKPRNRQKWTPQDRAEIRAHLRRLSELSPYLAVFVLPGGFAMLPALAWWLDRRRNRRPAAQPRSG